MRVELHTPPVTTAPGATFELILEVFNTSGVIDGIMARPVGLDPSWVVSKPAQLALFPESSDTLALEVTLPVDYPAGRHELAIEVSSSADPSDVEYVAFSIDVSSRADVVVQLEPERTNGVRRGKLQAVVLNAGNMPVELAFTAADQERALSFQFEPAVVQVPPSGSAASQVSIRTRMRWFGTASDVGFDLTASGRDLEVAAPGAFQQLPLIPRGVLTAGALAAIVAVWAAIFLLILSQLLGGDDPDKAAPPSFFATSEAALAAGAGPQAGPGGQKLDLAAVGATITGTVTTTSTETGIGRITVEAIRITRSGPVLTSSAATDEEGFYSVSGLPPGTYAVHFVNPGFRDVWYPAAPTRESGETIRVRAKDTREGVDAEVTGLPGSLSGVVDTGVEPGVVTASVVVRPLVGGVPGQPVAERSTGALGGFAVVGLATPLTYEVTATAPGYEPTTVVEQLDGGEQRLAANLRLSAGPGSISGLVTSGGAPLGGVTITGTAGEVEVTSATPTSGAVGRYSLADLPTPGTYLLTFERESFGAETIAVQLGPGENRTGLDVELARGAGSISGTVTDIGGNPLGDVEVTVNGGTTSVTARTLTAGARGSWSVSGLSPGEYTVTFFLAGFGTETIAVTLPRRGAVRNANATLVSVLGTLRGTVTNDGGTGLANIEVLVSDGQSVRRTVTASAPPETPGQYVVSGLAPGTYSVTFSLDGSLSDGFRQRTILVEIAAGQVTDGSVALTPEA
ncbi:MAG: carboxypeptidase regulatory-like domain-containing protein [Acidimicrobiales bacterium]